MRAKFGSDKGNRGAVIRWGGELDNGIWIRHWKGRKLQTRWKSMHGYLEFWCIVVRWGNPDE